MQDKNKGIDPAIKNLEKFTLWFVFLRYSWNEINIRKNGIQFNRSNHIFALIFWSKRFIGKFKNIFLKIISEPQIKRIKLYLSLNWIFFLLKKAMKIETKKIKALIGKADTRKNPPK